MTAPNSAAAEWRGYWYLPLAAALGYATSVLHVYSMGPFIEPLQHEFGWSRAQASSGITVAAFLSALFCIPIGMLVDRIGPRRVALIGAILMCSSVALLSTANGSTTQWKLLWVGVAVGTLWVQASVWTSAVTSRFQTSRGLALAVTLSGAAVAATVYPVLATWLIGEYGWRHAFMGMSGIWFVMVFPILFLFFRGAKDVKVKSPDEKAEVAAVLQGATLAEGFRSPAFYKLLIAGGMFAFTTLGIVVHFVPILTDSGADPLKAAGIASLVGIFSVVGRLGTGVLLDRFPSHVVGSCAFLVPLIGCTLLLAGGTHPVNQAVAAAMFGLTLGAEVDVIAYLTARFFGLKHFGALYGAMVTTLSMGTAFGPLASGAVYDNFGSYTPFLWLTMILMGLSSLALLSLASSRAFVEEAVPVH